MSQAAGQIGSSMADAIRQYVGQMGSAMENAVSIDEDAFMNAIQVNMDQDELTELLTSMMSDEDAAYENNLKSWAMRTGISREELPFIPEILRARNRS